MELFRDVGALSAFADGKMKKNNVFQTERMFCDVYCLEPGQSQDAHVHAGSDKVYYVLEGRAEIRIGSDSRSLPAGSAALAVGGEAHGVANPGPGRLRLLVFMAPLP